MVSMAGLCLAMDQEFASISFMRKWFFYLLFSFVSLELALSPWGDFGVPFAFFERHLNHFWGLWFAM